MISLYQIQDAMTRGGVSPLGQSLAAIVNDANLASLLLSVADFCGWQEDGEGGRIQLWTLRKPIPGHPKGSTVTRETIRRALFPSYGSATLPAGKPADFAAVESPGHG